MAVSAEQVDQEFDLTPVMELLKTRGRLAIKHTLGIGLRHATGDLLVKSCDEFLFYESIMGRELGGAALDGAQARELLARALRALQQQGALPVFASRLKQTMVALDSTFNEAF